MAADQLPIRKRLRPLTTEQAKMQLLAEASKSHPLAENLKGAQPLMLVGCGLACGLVAGYSTYGRRIALQVTSAAVKAVLR